MEQRKNTIARKQVKFYQEQVAARDILERLIKDLKECDENTDFRRKIGMQYLHNFTRFNILKNEADYVKRGLRMLCSGEISVETTLERTEELMDGLKKALSLYNEERVRELIQKYQK